MNVKFLGFIVGCSIFLIVSCSSPNQKKDAQTILDKMENAPFEELRTVRVMLNIVTDKIDPALFKSAVIDVLSTVGGIHISKDTSMAELLKAQEKPFALLLLKIEEIECPMGKFTVHFSCKMFELTKLVLNGQEWMSNVWEMDQYIDLSSHQELTDQINAMAQIFSAKYYTVNPSTVRPEFYIN